MSDVQQNARKAGAARISQQRGQDPVTEQTAWAGRVVFRVLGVAVAMLNGVANLFLLAGDQACVWSRPPCGCQS